MELTSKYRINWKRVWLAVLVGYVILVIGSNLVFGYIAYSHPWLIDWQDNPPIVEVYTHGK